MTLAKLRAAMVSMGKPKANVGALRAQLGITRQTLGALLSLHPMMSDGRFSEPIKGPLYERLCIFLDTGAMSDDQLVEVPRKQLVERLPCKVSIREGQPDVERNAAMLRCNAGKLEQGIEKGLTLRHRMNLDQIIQDDSADSL